MQYRPFRAAAFDCSACERSNAQTGTPFSAACPKHGPAPSRAHADKKPVSTLPANNRRVKSTFRSEEHTSELQSLRHLVCRLLLEKKKRARRRADGTPRRGVTRGTGRGW